MEENKNQIEKEENNNNKENTLSETSNNYKNPINKDLIQSHKSENIFQNISDNFTTEYKNEELNKFKDEILSYFADRDKYFVNLISTYKTRIQHSEMKYENLAKLIKLNYEEILSSQASLNNRLDKFKSYESFVAKTNDNITSHEIRINNLREDYNKTVQKYDKIYLDNLELPGYIGRCAKYKNCQIFFENVIKEINKFNNYKEKNNIDLKAYKEKLEHIIKTFQTLLNNNNDAQIKYINKINEKSNKENKNMVDNLSERVMELRIENSKHSMELIDKTSEIKEQIEKIKEMKGELLNEFYNKIDDYKIETNKAIKSFNEFKNEYAVIRKKFLELAEFIKDIRFKKNLGGDVNKKEINDLYKNLVKKSKKSNKDKNVELLGDISKIEKMDFNSNKINNNNNINKEQFVRGNKKHETYNYTKNIFKGNFIELNLNNNNQNENRKNDIVDININSNKRYDKNQNNINENKKEIVNEEVNKSVSTRKLCLLQDFKNCRSSKDIFNKKINLNDEKEQSLKKTYDITENNNTINNNINPKTINEQQQNQEKVEDIVKPNIIEIKSEIKSTPNKKEREKEKKCQTETDILTINDSSCSFNINNTFGVTGTLSDKNASNISLPIAYNINNVKCNKFVLNDICQEEKDNKIIKELAAELEQSTAKKIKKFGCQNGEISIQKIEPINLIRNISDINDIKDKNKDDNFEKNHKSSRNKTNNRNKDKIYTGKESNGEQTQELRINNKIFSLLNSDIENVDRNASNIDKKKMTTIQDTTIINSPKSVNSNIDKICNFNSDLDTNTETMNSKFSIFNKKLSDIEIFMKNRFIELTKQINEIKHHNPLKKQNLNRTVGYKSDRNIFNFFNSDNYSNNYSLNIRDCENQNPNIYKVIKLQKPEIYSHFLPSDIENIKRFDNFKESYTIDNFNKNKDKINDDLSIVKQFIEKKINIKNNNNYINKDIYKKNIKGIFRDKYFNFMNINQQIGGIDAYDNSRSKLRNNSTNIKNDMKYIDLKVLMNRKNPKNANIQKMNILLSGEKK